jgi:hypothetical protein
VEDARTMGRLSRMLSGRDRVEAGLRSVDNQVDEALAAGRTDFEVRVEETDFPVRMGGLTRSVAFVAEHLQERGVTVVGTHQPERASVARIRVQAEPAHAPVSAVPSQEVHLADRLDEPAWVDKLTEATVALRDRGVNARAAGCRLVGGELCIAVVAAGEGGLHESLEALPGPAAVRETLDSVFGFLGLYVKADYANEATWRAQAPHAGWILAQPAPDASPPAPSAAPAQTHPGHQIAPTPTAATIRCDGVYVAPDEDPSNVPYLRFFGDDGTTHHMRFFTGPPSGVRAATFDERADSAVAQLMHPATSQMTPIDVLDRDDRVHFTMGTVQWEAWPQPDDDLRVEIRNPRDGYSESRTYTFVPMTPPA